ncbi:MAG: DEAD/DEAH box helicase family protein, partial [Sphingomicrobium sp.]
MIGFQGVWRDYQAQALEHSDAYLADGRFHLVAAPGSGKTLLGLELVRRLGRTALILAPTVTIRDQWVDRLSAMFAPAGAPIARLATTRIDQACPITVLTYQKLYMAVQRDRLDSQSGEAETTGEVAEAPLSVLVANLMAQGPITLVLDEAHHLRREWWAALDQLRDALPDAVVVALTATPPYDVEPAEWRRYEALCGPIDEDIPIPALVKSGDLAPHQDLILLSLPVGDEGTAFALHVAAVNGFLETLPVDPAFRALLEGHPWMIEPERHVEQVLDNPDLFAAMMTYGQAIGVAVPETGRSLLGVGTAAWPPLTIEWLDLLLTALLFDGTESDPARVATIRRLRADCRRLGVLEGERVRLARERKFYS